MGRKIKKFLMNPWTVTVGGGLIVTGITTINDLIKKVKIFSTIKSIFHFLIKWILFFLNFKIKVWWILVVLSALIAIGGFVIYLIGITQSEDQEPKFLEYTEDIILNFKWKWTWEKTYDGIYRIENLHPVCLNCDTPLPNDVIFATRIKCIRCGITQYDRYPDIDNVKLLIEDNIRRKYLQNNDTN